MSSDINMVTIIGRCGRDPEQRSFSNGDKVVNFSVATSDTWRDRATGDKCEQTQWHNIVILNDRICDIATQYLRKGDRIAIVGKLKYREWEKDGIKRTTAEIVIEKFGGTLQLLGGKRQDDSAAPGSSGNGYADARSGRTTGAAGSNAPPDDDIPF